MAERNYLSIGQVVNLLRGAYPDLSNSKIRFLEDEGLIAPHRTPKGYRQYSKEDVDRLEVILHLQKTRYMPLNVIKQRLENATDLSTLAYEVGLLSDVPLKTEPKETKQKLHPIETIPDMLGVEISFIRSLAENVLGGHSGATGNTFRINLKSRADEPRRSPRRQRAPPPRLT